MSTAWITQSARRNSSSIFSTAFCERVSPNLSSAPEALVAAVIRSELPTSTGVGSSSVCPPAAPSPGALPAIRELSYPSER